MVGKIYGLAQRFQEQSPKDAWEDLFDYLKIVGFRTCYEDRDQLLHHFSRYIYQYRMYRNTRLTKKKLRDVLMSGREVYLDFLCNYNDETFKEAWRETRRLLQESEISATPVMITKLLMGFGGRTAAYDSKFLATVSGNPIFMKRGIDYFVKWLRDSGLPELRTHGDRNAIPWERVFDMALWYACAYEVKDLLA